MWPFTKKKQEQCRRPIIARGQGFYQNGDFGSNMSSVIIADAIIGNKPMFQETAPIRHAEPDFSPSDESTPSYDDFGGCESPSEWYNNTMF